MKQNAAGSAMAGFNIPPEVLELPDFKAASKMFISPGRVTRRAIWCSPNSIHQRRGDGPGFDRDPGMPCGAQPNTPLADASTPMGGYPIALRDT